MALEKLSNDLVITVNDSQRTIRMNFNLLNRLTYIVGAADKLPEAVANPEIREALMCQALAIRQPDGTRPVPANLEDLDFSPEDASLLLNFISDHVMDFFLQTLEHQNQQMLDNQNRMTQIRSTSTFMQSGLVSSTSKTPAA